jgi:sugar lactone lactonase YvrE
VEYGNLSFASGVTVTPVLDTTVQIVVPNYAYYYFRVRGVDPNQRLGRPSATRFSSVLAAMYIADAGGPSAVVFVGPFTATSRPAISVPVSGSPVGMAVDTAGHMAVCGVGMGVGDSVQLFAPPIMSGSVPVTKLAVAGCLFMAFDVAGNLYVATQVNSVTVFPAPFPFTGAPSDAIVRGLSQAKSVAFDAAHWLYVGNDTTAAPPCTVCRVNVYAPPYAADTLFSVGHGRLTSVGGIAVDAAGNLYVADINASKIVVYHAPLSGAPDSAFTITAGLSTPEGIAFDAAGNLYVVNLNGTVTIYRPPFSRASAPAVTIPASAGLRGPYGIALDK